MSQHDTLTRFSRDMGGSMEPDENGSWVRFEDAQAAISATQPAQASPRLIGWRTDDYLMETSDKAKAENWAPHLTILPIFEGDPHTKLQASAAQPAQAAQPVSRDVIRDVFLRNGFTIKDGCSDLKPYVYAAANALLEVAAAQPVQGVPQGWRIQWAPDLEPEEILVTAPNCEPGGMTLARNHANLAYRMLYALCRSLLTATPTPPAQQAAQSEPVKPLFAAKIAARKWAELQDAGARMQSIAFDGHKSGHPGTIDPWGVVRWGQQAAQGAGEVVSDYYPELLIARSAVQELEQKVFSLEQCKAILQASVASYQRDMVDPPAYLQDAVIKAAGLGAMAEQIAALKKQVGITQPAAGADVLAIATGALEEIALAGMSGTGQESEEGMRDWHARQAWKFISIAARAKAALAASGRQS